MPALEVLERELEDRPCGATRAHLVEGDGGLGLARRDPRQSQHALERAERGLEVADQLVDRAEIVPEVQPRREIVHPDARERLVEQPDRLLVLILGAGGLGGAPEPRRGLARVPREREVTADLFLRGRRTTLRVQLEPARHDPRDTHVAWPRRCPGRPAATAWDTRTAARAPPRIDECGTSTNHSRSASLAAASITVCRECSPRPRSAERRTVGIDRALGGALGARIASSQDVSPT